MYRLLQPSGGACWDICNLTVGSEDTSQGLESKNYSLLYNALGKEMYFIFYVHIVLLLKLQLMLNGGYCNIHCLIKFN